MVRAPDLGDSLRIDEIVTAPNNLGWRRVATEPAPTRDPPDTEYIVTRDSTAPSSSLRAITSPFPQFKVGTVTEIEYTFSSFAFWTYFQTI